MNLASKKTSLWILGITAIACSRIILSFLNDPEGGNLVVATGTAALVFVPSLVAYFFTSSGTKKLAGALCIQIILVIGLYFYLK